MSAVDGIDEFAAQLAGILKEKNAAYGDSFARVPTILADMYKGVPPETLEGILFTARILDKLGRIAQDPLGAGEDAYLDLAGYAMMMANMQRLKREAKAATGVMYLGDEAIEYRMPDGEPKAEAPSEPNGRIKRDRLPDVRIQPLPTGWYLCYPPENSFFNVYAGGFWTDASDATAFPTRRDAAEYCRKQGELNAAAVKNSIELYSGDWSAVEATDHGEQWVIRWPRVGQYFQAPHGDRAAKWIANPNEAAKFDTKEKATEWIENQRAGWASCE